MEIKQYPEDCSFEELMQEWESFDLESIRLIRDASYILRESSISVFPNSVDWESVLTTIEKPKLSDILDTKAKFKNKIVIGIINSKDKLYNFWMWKRDWEKYREFLSDSDMFVRCDWCAFAQLVDQISSIPLPNDDYEENQTIQKIIQSYPLPTQAIFMLIFKLIFTTESLLNCGDGYDSCDTVDSYSSEILLPWRMMWDEETSENALKHYISWRSRSIARVIELCEIPEKVISSVLTLSEFISIPPELDLKLTKGLSPGFKLTSQEDSIIDEFFKYLVAKKGLTSPQAIHDWLLTILKWKMNIKTIKTKMPV